MNTWTYEYVDYSRPIAISMMQRMFEKTIRKECAGVDIDEVVIMRYERGTQKMIHGDENVGEYINVVDEFSVGRNLPAGDHSLMLFVMLKDDEFDENAAIEDIQINVSVDENGAAVSLTENPYGVIEKIKNELMRNDSSGAVDNAHETSQRITITQAT